MDAQLSASFVAAVAALTVALVGWFSGQRREQRLLEKQIDLEKKLEDHKLGLARQDRREERAITAKAELDRIREPLIIVALDLAQRLDNIRNNDFLLYLSSSEESRRETALIGTLHRFARYWCVVETLYDRADLSKLLADSNTQPVAATLREIGRTFASDRHDGGKLMIWRDEQRAIAERSREQLAPDGCIGFASFVDEYDERFAQWFQLFSRDLPSAPASERMRLVQQHLCTLIRQLAPENVGYYKEQLAKLEAGASSSR